jgi:two-component system LytT family response regulator
MTLPRLHALLVDDEAPVRKRFQQLLAAHPEVLVVGEASSVATAAQLLSERAVDVVFLDIVMPGADGFGLVGALPKQTAVVFVTAHAEFAARAFDVDATDYLVKPVDPKRLAACLERVAAQTGRAEPLIEVTSMGLSRRVPTASIVAVEARGTEVKILFRDTPPVVALGGLGDWFERLRDSGLERVTRSLLVRPAAILRAERLSRDEMLLDLDGCVGLRLGRTCADRIERLLEEGKRRHTMGPDSSTETVRR